MPFDRDIFFSSVRPLFGNKLSQSQVDGMDAVLNAWEEEYEGKDHRWLAYPLATDMWETSSEMQPIEEYGKGEGMEYGKPDPKTGQTYYGRGYVQLTWADNYKKADTELGLVDEESCYLNADNALDPGIAAAIMFRGMMEGWFRSKDGAPQTLERYFNETTDDAFNAREIINGDKNYTKEWAGNSKVGDLIADYHRAFLRALGDAYVEEPLVPIRPDEKIVVVTIVAPRGVKVEVTVVEDD